MWYASINFGLERIAAEMLALQGAYNIKKLESAVLYESENLINFPVAVNQFRIINSFISKNVENAVLGVSRRIYSWPDFLGNTFRVIVMDCGKLVSVAESSMRKLEISINRQTNLKPNRSNPDIEIWLMRRSDETVYFMVRTEKHAPREKKLHGGELRPDIACAMLYLVSNPEKKPLTIADPFGGYGSIALSAVLCGGYKHIYTGDIDEKCVEYQKSKLSKYVSCHVKKWDAFSLPLENGSIDSIVTDPPWGEYENIGKGIYNNIGQAEFYDKFIRECRRIISSDGKMAVLTPENDCICSALQKYNFKFEILPTKINGKSACIYYTI